MSRADVEPSSDSPARILGYARVSTDTQALAPQVESLRAAGVVTVYWETASGAKRNRAQLARLLREVELGDVVLVIRLDRMAHSTRDLLNVLCFGRERRGLSLHGRPLGRHHHVTRPAHADGTVGPRRV